MNLKTVHPVLLVILVNVGLVVIGHLLPPHFRTIHFQRGLYMVALFANIALLKYSRDRDSMIALCLVVADLALLLVGFVYFGQLSPAWAPTEGIRFMLGDL